MDDKNKKEELPTPPSEENKKEDKKLPVEEVDDTLEDTDFDKTLEDLEKDKPAPKPSRTELEKATFTAKSTLKRIKELGGDPASLLEEEREPKPEEKPPVDTSQFVTKNDLARTEAQKIARSPSELKLIMWYVENKGMSVDDAHFLANKNRIKKITGEIKRATEAVPSNGGGGPGQRTPEKTDAPDLPDADKRRLIASGMAFDPAKKAYVGKKTQLRYDDKTKAWVNERL